MFVQLEAIFKKNDSDEVFHAFITVNSQQVSEIISDVDEKTCFITVGGRMHKINAPYNQVKKYIGEAFGKTVVDAMKEAVKEC